MATLTESPVRTAGNVGVLRCHGDDVDRRALDEEIDLALAVFAIARERDNAGLDERRGRDASHGVKVECGPQRRGIRSALEQCDDGGCVEDHGARALTWQAVFVVPE